MQDAAFVLRYEQIEIDKIRGWWIVTCWLEEDVTLRLKVQHTYTEDPDRCVAEVRLRASEEFQSIYEFWTSVYELTHPSEFLGVWDDLPQIWSREFRTMAQVWGRLTEIAEFGPSVAERYAREPESSLDSFSFPGKGAEGENETS